MQIVIKDASVLTQTINGKSGAFQSSSQTAWIELPSGERRKLRVRLGKDAKPYGAGTYNIGDASFTVSEYGDLGIGNLELLPVAAARALAG